LKPFFLIYSGLLACVSGANQKFIRKWNPEIFGNSPGQQKGLVELSLFQFLFVEGNGNNPLGSGLIQYFRQSVAAKGKQVVPQPILTLVFVPLDELAQGFLVWLERKRLIKMGPA